MQKHTVWFLALVLAFTGLVYCGCGSSGGGGGGGGGLSSLTIRGTLQTGSITPRGIQSFGVADGWTVVVIPNTASTTYEIIPAPVVNGTFEIPISDTSKTYTALLLDEAGKVVCPIDFDPSTSTAKIGIDTTVITTTENNLGTITVDTTNKLAVVGTAPTYVSNALLPEVDAATGAVVGAANDGVVIGGTGTTQNNVDKDNDGIPNTYDRDANDDMILRPFDAAEAGRSTPGEGSITYTATVFYNLKVNITDSPSKTNQWITIGLQANGITPSPISSGTLINLSEFSYLANAQIRESHAPFDGTIAAGIAVIDNIDIGAPAAGEVWKFQVLGAPASRSSKTLATSQILATVEAQMDVVFTVPPQIKAFKFSDAEGWINADTTQNFQGTLHTPTFEVRWERPTPEDSFDIKGARYTLEMESGKCVSPDAQEAVIMDFGVDDGTSTTLEATVNLTGFLIDGDYVFNCGLCARSRNNDNIATNIQLGKHY
ncbi:MAG: hypothetical protein WC901_05990 [Candidatus Margulisiibacteriota bacterium]